MGRADTPDEPGAAGPQSMGQEPSPGWRRYASLNRLAFFGWLTVMVFLGWVGADIGLVVLLTVAYFVVTIALLHPGRSWWGPDVNEAARNRQLAKRLVMRSFKQDIVLGILLCVGILAALVIIRSLVPS